MEENKTIDKSAEKNKKLNIAFLVAAALFTVCVILYLIRFIQGRGDIALAFRYKIWDWDLFSEAVDFLITLALAVFSYMTAFNYKHIKKMSIPVFAGAAIILYLLTFAFINSSISAMDTFYVIINSISALAYICLGIFALKKGISIVFAAIFSTYTTALVIWYNMDGILYYLKYASILDARYEMKILAFTFAILVFVWACAARSMNEAKNKDIIKRNIPLSVVLSVITLGIYAIFWIKSISEDIAKLEGEKTNSYLETALFFTVPFYCMYWYYTKGRKIAKLADDADMSILFSIQGLFCIGVFAFALIQTQIHKAIGLSKE